MSKTDLLKGIGCVRRAWLGVHRRDLRPALSSGVLELIETGKRIGSFAQGRYPDGQMAGSASRTRELLSTSANCLFEATLVAEGLSARIDVLWRTDDGRWVIDEVKSGTIKDAERLMKEKRDLVLDLALQVYVAELAGLEVSAARLVMADGSYTWPGGDLDPDTMMSVVDMTLQCHQLRDDVLRLIEEIGPAIAAEEEPPAPINTHCKKCDYQSHCMGEAAADDVIFLPKITPKVVSRMRDEGYNSIHDIPEDYKLTDRQRIVRDSIISGKRFVSEGLREALNGIDFPAVFIDYESSNSAFPLYPGTRPYQHVCFQWSAHRLDSAESEPQHFEFLPDHEQDPRTDFCCTLWDAIQGAQTIVHYTGFEIHQLKPMVGDGTPFAAELLEALEARSYDLEKVVGEHVYDPLFLGKTSIKYVLPALVPRLTYKDLVIGDGQAASAGYREMIAAGTAPGRRSELREALLAYCHLDTFAMVELYRTLRQLCL